MPGEFHLLVADVDDLSAQCARIKCGQSSIHAVPPSPPLYPFKSTTHTQAGNPHLMTELPANWLMEAPFSPFLRL